MAAKFFTGLPLDGPDPECVQGYGEAALAAAGTRPSNDPDRDHSHRQRVSKPVPLVLGVRPPADAAPMCAEDPLAGFRA